MQTVAACALLLGFAIGVVLQLKWPAIAQRAEIVWIDFSGPDTIVVPASGAAARQRARFQAASKTAPLIVDLHQWSEDERGTLGDDIRLDQATVKRGWNYIRPALAGPNNSPKACCSAAVIDGILAAINYATEHGKVDRRAIYVIGQSGGGYTALCGAHSGRLPVRTYYAWVPVTDLENWYNNHRFDKYGTDILSCTSSNGALNVAEARKRSPQFMSIPSSFGPVKLFHGIRDGMSTSVSPEQTMHYFNRIARETGHPDAIISPEIIAQTMYAHRGPEEKFGRMVGDRIIHLHRQAGDTSLTVFEGNHEGLIRPVVQDIDKDWAALKHSQ